MHWHCRGLCELCDSGMVEGGSAGNVYHFTFSLICLVSSSFQGL